MANLENRRQLALPSWVSWFKDPVFLLTITLVFSADQVSKALVRNGLTLGESIPRTGDIRITHAVNSGGAFGLFPDQTMFLIVASIVGIGILLLVYRNHSLPGSLIRVSLGLQLGGAVGNLLDRLRVGEVTDFIEVGAWPIFNLADASIVIGIVMLVYLFLFAEKRGRGAPATLGPGYVDGWEGSPEPDEAGTEDGLEPSAEVFCPACDSVMEEAPMGWECSNCGVRELLKDREIW